MANYNNNERSKGGYFDQYVNFDQFLMQHNINCWSPMRGSQYENGRMGQGASSFNSNQSFQPPNGAAFHPQSPSGFSAAGSSNWIQNSTLTATASEFIPHQAPHRSGNSPLLATASEFVPRAVHSDKPELSISETKQSHANPCDTDRNRRTANKVNDIASNTESVIAALNQTHISEPGTSASKPHNSTGGAIKKVRSQDYRNDSRDRISNGEIN